MRWSDGIERAFFDLQLVAGGLLDRAHHGEPVHRSPGEGLEDQQVERAANEVEFHVREEIEPKNLRYKVLRLRHVDVQDGLLD